MYEDFQEDCVADLGLDIFLKISSILDFIEDNDFEDTEKDGITVSCSREKIHQLQENICVSISSDDFEIELLYENGINNGTELNDYSINSENSFTNENREYSVVTGIELDTEAMDANGFKYSIDKAQILLDNNRAKIMKLIKEQNYDNYVTGGGTNKTDSYYSSQVNKLNSIGLYWKVLTKTETVQANFI